MRSHGDPEDYVSAVRMRLGSVGLWAVAGLAISLGITAVLTPIYEVRSVLLFSTPSGPTDLASALGTAQSPVIVVQGVVHSLRMSRLVAKKTGVRLQDVEGMVRADSDVESNQLLIRGIHKSPETAMLVATTVLEEVRRIQNEVGFNLATRQVASLDAAILQREKERALAVQKMLDFQKRAKTVTDPSRIGDATFYAKVLQQIELDLGSTERQIQGLGAGVARLQGDPLALESWIGANPLVERALEAEIRFRSLQQTLGPDSPQLRAAESQYRSLDASLKKELQNRISMLADRADPEVTALLAKKSFLTWQRGRWRQLVDRAPAEAIEFARLTEDLNSKEAILTALRKRREESRILAEVDRFRWSILEKPELQPEPVNKNWFQNGLLGVLIGASVGAGLALRRFERNGSRALDNHAE